MGSEVQFRTPQAVKALRLLKFENFPYLLVYSNPLFIRLLRYQENESDLSSDMYSAATEVLALKSRTQTEWFEASEQNLLNILK